jgi:hypothetical protein
MREPLQLVVQSATVVPCSRNISQPRLAAKGRDNDQGDESSMMNAVAIKSVPKPSLPHSKKHRFGLEQIPRQAAVDCGVH